MEPSSFEIEVLNTLEFHWNSKGDCLLSGNAFLALSAKSIVALNACFERIRETDFETSFETTPTGSTNLPVEEQIQKVYDFIQKLVKLKVSHKHTSLPGRINLAPFRSLRQLELKGVPIHLTLGVTKIRDHIESLSCSRCVPALKDVFESCCGDHSETSRSWRSLTSAYFRNNNLVSLDTSLRLVPMLTSLDISHNIISDTANHLENLTDLRALNLSYNRVERIPRVALSSQPRLRVLLLRYNALQALDGLELLTGLHQLDLHGNLLASHKQLTPLRPLAKLYTLSLTENPISLHSQHRRLTISCLHALCITQIELDGKRLTRQEVKHHAQHVSSVPIGSLRQEVRLNASDVDQSTDFFDSHMALSGATSQSDTDVMVRVIPEKRRKSANRKKARKANISDQETQDTESVGSAKASYTEDHRSMQEDIERMRRELGPAWLQGLHHHLPQDTALSRESSQENIKSTNSEPEIQGQQLFSKEVASYSDAGNHFNNTNKVSRENNNVDVKDGAQATIKQDTTNIKANGVPEKSIINNKSSLCTDKSAKENDEVILTNGAGALSKDDVPGKGVYSPPPERASSTEATATRIQEPKIQPRSTTLSSQDSDDARNGKPALMSQSSSSNSDVQPDYGPESEPFIVSSLDDPEEEYLITVTDRYLLEKDINNDVMEELDLTCLLDVSAMQRTISSLGNDVKYCLKMTFDYVNKSKRDRQIVMENEESSKSLIDLIKPYADANKQKLLRKSMKQCLKCSHEFLMKSHKRHARNSSLGGIVRISSFGKNVDKLAAGFVEESPVCPQCGSDLVIDATPEQIAAYDSNNSTPVGSLSKAQAMTSPLATSSALTSPMPASNTVKMNPSAVKRKMPWQIGDTSKTEEKTIEPSGENSSFTSCSELSQSYKSLKDAVLAASTTTTSFKSLGSTNTMRDTVNSSTNSLQKSRQGDSDVFKTPQGSFSLNPDKSAQGANVGFNLLQEESEKAVPYFHVGDKDDSGDSHKSMLGDNVSEKENQDSGKETKMKHEDSDSDTVDNKNPFAADIKREKAAAKSRRSRVIRHSGSDLLLIEEPPAAETKPNSNRNTFTSSNSANAILKDSSAEKSSSGYESSSKSSQDMAKIRNTDKAQNRNTENAKIMSSSSDEGTDVDSLDYNEGISIIQTSEEESVYDNLYQSDVSRKSSKEDKTTSKTDNDAQNAFNGMSLSPVNENQMSKQGSRAKLPQDIPANPVKMLTRRQSSDIVVINENSPSNSRDFDLTENQDGGEGDENGECKSGEGSSCGSLTKSAVSDMVEYMRHSIYDKDGSLLNHGAGKRNSDDAKAEMQPADILSSCDFSEIDHRLKLHLHMNVFANDEEEFQLLLRCGLVQYTKGGEQVGLLVASNTHLYIFIISGPEKMDNIPSWLKLQLAEPLTDLRYLHIGLGHQSFRLESELPATCFHCLVRDEIRCKTFIAQFTALLQNTSFTAKSQLEGITKNDPDSIQSLMDDVIKVANGDEEEEDSDEIGTFLKFINCYKCGEKNKKPEPVCAVVTYSHLCLAQENYRWPLTNNVDDPKIKVNQFLFLSAIDITELAHAELSESQPLQMTLHSSAMDASDSSKLTLQFATQRSKMSLLGALQMAYQQQLDVDLDVNQCS